MIKKYIFVIIWILFLLLIIHNCHNIINVVNEHFSTTLTPNNNTTISPNIGSTTLGPNIDNQISTIIITTTLGDREDDTNLKTTIETIIRKHIGNIENKIEFIRSGDITITTAPTMTSTFTSTSIQGPTSTSIPTTTSLDGFTVNSPSDDDEDEDEYEYGNSEDYDKIKITIYFSLNETILKKIKSDIEAVVIDHSAGCPEECPLASVLSSYSELQGKWGDKSGECVKISNFKDSKCARCPPGTFVDYNNYYNICSKCPRGQYSDQSNSLECKKCPKGDVPNDDQTGCMNNTDSVDTVKSCPETNYYNFLDDNEKIDETLINTIHNDNMNKLKHSNMLRYRLKQAEQKYDNFRELNDEQLTRYLNLKKGN